MALDIIHESVTHIVVQVRNAVFVVSGYGDHATDLPDDASLHRTATQAVDTLRRSGWA